MIASSGAQMQYRFGQKNNWRRAIWNEVARRLPRESLHECLVAYLAGSQDLDAEVATQKGFARTNLIAIERDFDVCKSLRARGVITICADFVECLRAWPMDSAPRIIFGDFCSGLNESIITMLIDVTYQHANSVFAFNFLRGRDPASGPVRAKLEALAPGCNQKHRGRQFGLLAAFRAIDKWPRDLIQGDHPGVLAARNMQARQFSYRSEAHQTFDSLVIYSPARSLWDLVKTAKREEVKKIVAHEFSPTTPRLIAAALAHRTMRINRSGSYA